jgi:hypothetical protein
VRYRAILEAAFQVKMEKSIQKHLKSPAFYFNGRENAAMDRANQHQPPGLDRPFGHHRQPHRAHPILPPSAEAINRQTKPVLQRIQSA